MVIILTCRCPVGENVRFILGGVCHPATVLVSLLQQTIKLLPCLVQIAGMLPWWPKIFF